MLDVNFEAWILIFSESDFVSLIFVEYSLLILIQSNLLSQMPTPIKELLYPSATVIYRDK